MEWIALKNIAQLSTIDTESAVYPVLIMKHSTRCSISSAALNRLERNWKSSEVPKLKTYFLDLIAYRDVSNKIASSYGIEHQSPQILVISNGECIYNTSHTDISYADLLEVVKNQVA